MRPGTSSATGFEPEVRNAPRAAIQEHPLE
jgi:hypothetical protein